VITGGVPLNDCGCCEGVAVRTPGAIDNRPGLDSIAYRAGTHPSFKESMLACFSDSRLPALRALGTRNDDDFSIALIDAWATVADVLTFYQERIANESYLRTATERLSIRELASLIGYKLDPGVAAGVDVALTLDDPPVTVAAPLRASVTRTQEPITFDAGLKIQSVPGKDEDAQIFETVEPVEARVEWNAIRPRLTEPQVVLASAEDVWLQGVNSSVQPGDILLVISSRSSGSTQEAALHRVASVTPDASADRTHVLLEATDAPTSQVVSTEAGVWVMRVVSAPFGHNAPKQAIYDKGVFQEFGEWTLMEEYEDRLTLDARYPKIVRTAEQHASWVVVEQDDPDEETSRIRMIAKVESVIQRSAARYGISGAITELQGDSLWKRGQATELSLLRSMVIYAQSEKHPLAEVPLPSSVSGSILALNGSYPGLQKDQKIALFGHENSHPVAEVTTIAGVSEQGGFTTLTLTNNLQHSYQRDTVIINANVAAATHGESVREVLGSGNAAQVYQTFTLRQPPLTWISAPATAGAQSTLDIYVSDVLWREVPFLYGHGPDARVYITSTDEEGRTVVRFGNGVNGSRLPTGRNNVRADYRRGVGLDGLVKRSQLTQLLSRPLGLKEAINPEAAAAAQDPETRDLARRNAPLTVLTMDRAVSLQDYADFARTFAGIAKAHAVWVWNGWQRVVFITVAGPDGAPIDSATLANLTNALRTYGDKYASFSVESYHQALFRVTGQITIRADQLPDKVRTKVSDALLNAFSFDSRDFGWPVALSEVIAILHTIEGVLAVDIDSLYRNDDPTPELSPRLYARLPAKGSDGLLLPAELLLLDKEALNGLSVVV
jgi:predicted phage baseplate assembly protein